MVTILAHHEAVDLRYFSFGFLLPGSSDRSSTHDGFDLGNGFHLHLNGYGFKFEEVYDPVVGSIYMPVAGVLTNWAMKDGLNISGLHVDMAALGAAARTPSLSDDKKLLAQAMDGHDMYRGGPNGSIMSTFGGDDRLIGGGGGDILFGGTGADTFIYQKLHDSTSHEYKYDVLMDFSAADHDKIDLSAFNGRLIADGDAALNFIGTNELSHEAGELHVFHDKDYTYLGADIDGNGKDDFLIAIRGNMHLTLDSIVL
jgi:Ca2+-binding RTX toxin-like protein